MSTAVQFVSLGQCAVVELSFAVDNAPQVCAPARVRTAYNSEPMVTLQPQMVTICYAHGDDGWVVSGIEISGPRVGRRTNEALLRYVPGVHEDPPQWVADFARLRTPTSTPY